MSILTRIACVLLLCPALLLAGPEAKALGFVRVLTAQAAGAAQAAGSAEQPASDGYVTYTLGSAGEELTVEFPTPSREALLEMPEIDNCKMVLFFQSLGLTDNHGVFLFGSGKVAPEAYSDLKKSLMDPSNGADEGMVMEELKIEEKDGLLKRSAIVIFSADSELPGQEIAMRYQIILAQHHMFFLMVSGQAEELKRSPLAESAQRYFDSATLR